MHFFIFLFLNITDRNSAFWPHNKYHGKKSWTALFPICIMVLFWNDKLLISKFLNVNSSFRRKLWIAVAGDPSEEDGIRIGPDHWSAGRKAKWTRTWEMPILDWIWTILGQEVTLCQAEVAVVTRREVRTLCFIQKQEWFWIRTCNLAVRRFQGYIAFPKIPTKGFSPRIEGHLHPLFYLMAQGVIDLWRHLAPVKLEQPRSELI